MVLSAYLFSVLSTLVFCLKINVDGFVLRTLLGDILWRQNWPHVKFCDVTYALQFFWWRNVTKCEGFLCDVGSLQLSWKILIKWQVASTCRVERFNSDMSRSFGKFHLGYCDWYYAISQIFLFTSTKQDKSSRKMINKLLRWREDCDWFPCYLLADGLYQRRTLWLRFSFHFFFGRTILLYSKSKCALVWKKTEK